MTLSPNNTVNTTWRANFTNGILDAPGGFYMDDYNGLTFAEADEDIRSHGWKRAPKFDTLTNWAYIKRRGVVRLYLFAGGQRID